MTTLFLLRKLLVSSSKRIELFLNQNSLFFLAISRGSSPFPSGCIEKLFIHSTESVKEDKIVGTKEHSKGVSP